MLFLWFCWYWICNELCVFCDFVECVGFVLWDDWFMFCVAFFRSFVNLFSFFDTYAALDIVWNCCFVNCEVCSVFFDVCVVGSVFVGVVLIVIGMGILFIILSFVLLFSIEFFWFEFRIVESLFDCCVDVVWYCVIVCVIDLLFFWFVLVDLL